MGDFWKDFKFQISERLTNPLLGSFIASWFVWNWNLILVLLFGDGYSERLQVVQSVIDGAGAYYLQLWAFPLVSAGVFILVYPFAARLVYWYWESQQKKIKAMRQRIEDETPITQEEATRLRRFNRDRLRELEIQIEEWQRRYQEVQKRLADRDNDCEKLDSDRESLIEEILNLKTKLPAADAFDSDSKLESGSSLPKIYEQFPEEAIKAAKAAVPFEDEQAFATLLAFVKAQGGTAQDVAEAGGLNRIYVDYGIDRLIGKGMLERGTAGRLRLSDRGKMLVVKSGLVAA